jgi:RND family efflux transporter MFP subunit
MYLMIILLAAGCQEDKQHTSEEEGTSRVAVDVVRARTGQMQETVEGIGVLKAAETVEIRPELAATVEKVAFEEGQRVAKGDLLYKLDDSDLLAREKVADAALETAQTRLRNARWKSERIEELRDRDAASSEEYKELRDAVDEAQAGVQRARGELDLVREQLDDCRITAPLAGTVGQTHVDVGDFVDIGDPLTVLYSDSFLEVEFTLPERAVGRVRSGQQVQVLTETVDDHPFDGEVTYVSPSVRQATHDLLVKARIDDSNNELKPGLFAKARVVLETYDNALILPEEALVESEEGFTVFVVQDDHAEAREVTTGLRQPGQVEIRTGVEAGESVIVRGQMRLEDGTRVSIKNASDGHSTSAPEAQTAESSATQPTNGAS